MPCHALQVCILAPDGSRSMRRLRNAAASGLCSACLDVHSNCILAGAGVACLARGAWGVVVAPLLLRLVHLLPVAHAVMHEPSASYIMTFTNDRVWIFEPSVGRDLQPCNDMEQPLPEWTLI